MQKLKPSEEKKKSVFSFYVATFYFENDTSAETTVSVVFYRAERVRYFVLLNYSYKSWSIITTRDIFENCWS